jgi:cytochrome P450
MANAFTAMPFSVGELGDLTRPDPQPAYDALAKQCPMHRGPDGTLTLMRMQDILAVNKHAHVLGPGAHGPTMGGKRPLLPLDLDGEEHLKYRRLLDPLFSARKVATFEPAVRKLADELIDGFIDDGEADLLERFCEPLPSIFFLRLMGLPAADLPGFIAIKNAILGHLPPGLTFAARMAAVREASARCYDYLGGALDARDPVDPGDDMIGWLMRAEVDGQRLGREQLLDVCYLIVLAGLDTVGSAMACILARLAREPGLRQRLVAEPRLWAPAVEELLRFESPVQHGFRTPSQDLEIAGEVIPAGTTFFLSWAAANLDPAAFKNPLSIDLERQPNPHLAFGSGPHRCLGIYLARMELRAALEQLHRRIPEYSLRPGHELVFSGKPRTVNGLPLIWR